MSDKQADARDQLAQELVICLIAALTPGQIIDRLLDDVPLLMQAAGAKREHRGVWRWTVDDPWKPAVERWVTPWQEVTDE